MMTFDEAWDVFKCGTERKEGRDVAQPQRKQKRGKVNKNIYIFNWK